MSEIDKLEKRISAALGNPQICSADLVELITEVQTAADVAEKNATAEKAKALDLVASPDGSKAHEALVAAELSRDRLKAILPRLRNKLAEALAAEQRARWLMEYKRIEKMRDQAAEKFAHQCPDLLGTLAALFREVDEIDKECTRVNSNAPSGEQRRLDFVELTARGLKEFTHSQPSIANTVRLPNWEQSSTLAWPPPQPAFAAVFAATTVPLSDPRYSADWWKFIEQENAERRKVAERRAAEEEALQSESRRKYEEALRRQK